MNEGLEVYRNATIPQRAYRLQLSGLQPAWDTYQNITGENVYRQSYLVQVYNLNVVGILPLGTGAAMGSKLRTIQGNPEVSGRSGTKSEDGREPVMSTGETASSRGIEGGLPQERLTMQRGTAGILQVTAVRALYCLGLDSGEVMLTTAGPRRYAVARITPLARQPGKPLPEPYARASEALALSLAREQPGRPGLLMGMDPEFLLLRVTSGRVVPASRFLPTDGVAGCDAGPPGTRGAFPVAELRPAPRGEPRALLAQLMSAAAMADRLVADRSLHWRAGGMPLKGWALGGHLHFSGVALTAPLLRALDNYLALPLRLLEDARAAARRPRYGVLGDFRLQPHGGFEYRTLPSFLVSPVIAKGVVYLAHLIVSRYEDLSLRPLDREELYAAYYSGDPALLRAAFPPLRDQLRALDGYSQAERHIEPLFSLIAEGKRWDESRDIRALWRIKGKQQTKVYAPAYRYNMDQ